MRGAWEQNSSSKNRCIYAHVLARLITNTFVTDSRGTHALARTRWCACTFVWRECIIIETGRCAAAALVALRPGSVEKVRRVCVCVCEKRVLTARTFGACVGRNGRRTRRLHAHWSRSRSLSLSLSRIDINLKCIVTCTLPGSGESKTHISIAPHIDGVAVAVAVGVTFSSSVSAVSISLNDASGTLLACVGTCVRNVTKRSRKVQPPSAPPREAYNF